MWFPATVLCCTSPAPTWSGLTGCASRFHLTVSTWDWVFVFECGGSQSSLGLEAMMNNPQHLFFQSINKMSSWHKMSETPKVPTLFTLFLFNLNLDMRYFAKWHCIHILETCPDISLLYLFPAGGKLLLWGQIPSLSQVSDQPGLKRLWTPQSVPVAGGKVRVKETGPVLLLSGLCCAKEMKLFSVWAAYRWILKVSSVNHICLRAESALV